VIRFVFQAVFMASVLLASAGSTFGAGYSTADDSLQVSQTAPPVAGAPPGLVSASDLANRRNDGRSFGNRPGLARLASTESSPTDLPQPLDPDQVFPPGGRPNQRLAMDSSSGTGSTIATDQPSSVGRSQSNSHGNAYGGKADNAYPSNDAAPCGPGGQCNNNRWGWWRDDCNGNGWPKLYASTEAVFLWRDNRSAVQPVVESISNESTIFNTHSADFDTGIGPRIMLGMRPDACSAWELQYFSALDFNGEADVDSIENLAAPGALSQLPGWTDADRMRVDYTSELHNVEINYLHSWGRLSLLGGFRFVRLSDDFGLQATAVSPGILSGPSSIVSNEYHVHSENNLYGAQLGGRYRFCCDRFFGEFTGKAGLFGNDLNQSQFLTDINGGGVVRNFTVYDGTTALVADMNISAGFQLCCDWAVRCGYNLMWIDQVALAADQLNFNLGSTAGTHIEKRGDVFLHGINVGLEGRW
jgi:hypothetical protein